MADSTSAETRPGLMVVTHGAFAEELVQAAKTIVGDDQRLVALSIGWHDDVDAAMKRLRTAIAELDGGSGVLILTDMFGGTPTNLALTLHDPGHVEIVTGVNLPMLIRFVSMSHRGDLADFARRIGDQGREAIQVASKLLEAAKAEG